MWTRENPEDTHYEDMIPDNIDESSYVTVTFTVYENKKFSYTFLAANEEEAVKQGWQHLACSEGLYACDTVVDEHIEWI